MANMKPKTAENYRGSLQNFADNEDGRALLIPGKQLTNGDTTDTNGNLHHLTKINRFDLPEGFLFMGGLRGYIFMTRPDLNLYDEKNLTSLQLNPNLKSVLGWKELITRGTPVDKENISALQANTGFPSPFIPVLTNYCTGHTPEDQSLDTIEKGETHHGMKVRYGKHAMHSRSGGTFTLTFSDSKFLPVYKLLSVWTDYIEMVFLGDVSPREIYIKQGILDYAASMYYIVTKADGTEIVYWEKYVGVFPKTRPDSAFATTKGQLTHPEYQVQFEYAFKSKSSYLDPVVLSEINTLAGWTKKDRNQGTMQYLNNIETYFPTYDLVNNTIGTPLVHGPKIEFLNGRFYLRWI